MDNLAVAEKPNLQEKDTISVGKPVKMQPGGFWRRFVATMLDGFVIGLILSPVSIGTTMMMAKFAPAPGAQPDPKLFLIQILVTYAAQFTAIYFYYGYFYSQKGASPGKMLLGLNVIDTKTGRNLTYWRAFFRETIGKMVSAFTLTIGFLMAAFRKDGKALHDLMFNTQVLHKPKK